MKKRPTTREASQLVSLMFVLGRHMRDEFHRLARKDSCSFLGFQTLRYIKAKKDSSMRDVAAHFMITPPAATLLVEGLVEERLIARAVDTKDRRTIRLRVTAKGNALLEKNARHASRALARLFSGLTPGEQAAFASLLKKVIKEK